MQQSELTFSDFSAIVKRRKWHLILPMLLIFVAACSVAVLLPPVYKSTATILIEEQDVPQEFVMTMVTSYAEKRIQSIKQRIMSANRLLDIINQFDLYKDLRAKKTTEELIEKIRGDIKLEPISADVLDRRTGRTATAMIAFNLSFEGHEKPEVVFKVANMLASLFLKENLVVRQRQTRETAEFLEEELGNIEDELASVDKRISEFKTRNIESLPEMLSINQQRYFNIESEIADAKERLKSLKETEIELRVRLEKTEPYLDEKDPDTLRLEELRIQLTNLRSRFSDKYPDVRKIKTEIQELEKRVQDKEQNRSKEPDNPVYIELSARLAGIRVEINSIKSRLAQLEKKKRMYATRIETTPKIEEDYRNLLVLRNNLQSKKNDLMQKLMESRIAYGLEREQKGERFTIVDPPRVPEKPYKPNRLAILLVGLILGIGAGIANAVFFEHIDDSIRDVNSLVSMTGFPVLAVIPEILTASDIRKRRIKKILIFFLVLLLITGTLAAFHWMVMDLNVFWAKLERKLSLFL